mgnify:CR=1 FL=1
MAQDKRTFLGGMNKDVDTRLIKNPDYIDALNIRVASSTDGTIGAVENIEGNKEVPFEFSIMIAPNTWYPLTKGKLKKVAKSPLQEDLIGRHYREFDPMTPVGWRGSAIPWKHLAALPLIHHIEDVTLGVV